MAAEESKPLPEQSDKAKPSVPARRGRRGGRRSRGRGRRPPPPHSKEPSASPGHDTATEEAVEPFTEVAEPAETDPVTSGPVPHDIDERSPEPHFAEAPAPVAPAVPKGPHHPAPPAAVLGAIDEVNHIISTLQQTLDGMEEVLETLELAERQKDADEREIESLRHALRQLHRPREGGHHPPR
jgi:hypothetical protein